MFSYRCTEGCLTLDSNRLRREGVFEPGKLLIWRWPLRYGRGEARCLLRCLSRCRLEVCYRHESEWAYDIGLGSEASELSEHLLYELPITWTPCNYGGERPWLHCPNRGCGRRVRKLYLAGRYFVCRRRGRLNYTSQSESPRDRAHRRLTRIARKLGEHEDGHLLPPRPKGMHRSTYDRISNEYFAAEDTLDRFFVASVARLCSRS